MLQSHQISLMLVAFVCAFLSFSQANQVKRSITLQNDSGSKVEVWWLHPDTNEKVLQSTPFIYNGASFSLNSFVSHEFEVREIPGKSGACKGGPEPGTCGIGYFKVKDTDDQKFFVREGTEVVYEDNKTIAKDMAKKLLEECQGDAIEAAMKNPEKAAEIIQGMAGCVEKSVSDQLEVANEEIAFQATVRKGMGELLENYTCADFELPTTEELRKETWRYKKRTHKVNIMHDRDSSQIHLIENFISPKECDAMEKTAQKKLHRATVADGKGGSELSPNRKAMQAGIKIPWDKEKKGDPLTTISRKVYEYTEHVLGLGIDEHGQEDLMSIQYFGRGESEEEPDRYMPHCDGDCTGMQHKSGQRMATVVMYCEVPTKGGATNFRNSNIHVVPKKGSATFFSYIDPETFKMDSGFTEHSGCPVIEGEKKIVTQWVRLGVDSENPWDSFNTLGIKYSKADED